LFSDFVNMNKYFIFNAFVLKKCFILHPKTKLLLHLDSAQVQSWSQGFYRCRRV
jgi:hypothetical protein